MYTKSAYIIFNALDMSTVQAGERFVIRSHRRARCHSHIIIFPMYCSGESVCPSISLPLVSPLRSAFTPVTFSYDSRENLTLVVVLFVRVMQNGE